MTRHVARVAFPSFPWSGRCTFALPMAPSLFMTTYCMKYKAFVLTEKIKNKKIRIQKNLQNITGKNLY